jgi:hypothetical protein
MTIHKRASIQCSTTNKFWKKPYYFYLEDKAVICSFTKRCIKKYKPLDSFQKGSPNTTTTALKFLGNNFFELWVSIDDEITNAVEREIDKLKK